MDTQIHQTTATAVRPLRVDLPDEALADLRCIGATRFPDNETVADATQDVQLAIMKELARYWDTELLDHDTRSYVKMSHAFYGHPEGELTRDEILDNITLYWLTNTGASSARLYWETKVAALNASDGSIPVAMTVFPDEYYHAPRSWAVWAYPNLIYFHEVDRGGHFAMWEEPEFFAAELRRGLLTQRRRVAFTGWGDRVAQLAAAHSG